MFFLVYSLYNPHLFKIYFIYVSEGVVDESRFVKKADDTPTNFGELGISDGVPTGDANFSEIIEMQNIR